MAAALLMEIRQRTRSGLLILRELKPDSWPVDITVMPSLIELKMDEDCQVLSLPPEVTIVPSSCRGLQYIPGEGLHMRLLMQGDFNAKLLPAIDENLKPQKSCSFYCQSCGNSIISNRTFLRVLSLPGENWNDLVDEWCCHPSPFNDSILQPQNGDCFLGSNYFLVDSGTESPGLGLEILDTHSQGGTSNPKANKPAICKRCKTLLGEVKPSGVTKYYFTELLIQSSENGFITIPRSAYIQSILAHSLIELSSTRSTFRFSIQGTDGAIYILVWLLNYDSFLVESAEKVVSSKVFRLFEYDPSSESRPLEIWKACKVLYHPCVKSRKKDLVDAWGNDAGVHTLTFPTHTCLELLLVLSQSNVSLPPSLRWMNYFQVAFLKM